MKTLAIECATQACSVALFEDDSLIANRHDIIGRGHAEQLIPMIAGLPQKGLAQRILVSLGPGSFTGVRIGLAAAQSLALAWQAEILGYPTLALVAAMVGQKTPGAAVTVCMSAGHGEWFMQDFGSDMLPENAARSLTPEAARQRPCHAYLAGSSAADLAARLNKASLHVHDVLPDARLAGQLPPDLFTSEVRPFYGRAPDARPNAAPASSVR